MYIETPTKYWLVCMEHNAKRVRIKYNLGLTHPNKKYHTVVYESNYWTDVVKMCKIYAMLWVYQCVIDEY